MQELGPWKVLKTKDQWIYRWDPLHNSILVSNLIYIWGKSYTDAEILDQIPTNFKSNSLDQIKDLISLLLSKSNFTPESAPDLILIGNMPLSHFAFSWTFTCPRLDQSEFYKQLTLPLLQMIKCSNPLITNETKFHSSLSKSSKNVISLFETPLVTTAFERLGSVTRTFTRVAHVPQEQETQDYEENLKKSLSKKKRKSLFS